jgi:hypothetical protein
MVPDSRIVGKVTVCSQMTRSYAAVTRPLHSKPDEQLDSGAFVDSTSESREPDAAITLVIYDPITNMARVRT